jgi:6-pyruvoyltetrahydropterin/6-carboxytetrahydropterin synthase
MAEVFREYRFEAAHRLPKLPEGHKCARLHGHSFIVQLHCRGPIESATGWVVDFYDIDRAFAPCFDALDHHYLNEVDGLDNPTSEAIARWIWERVQPSLPSLCRVLVKETCDSGCVYAPGRDTVDGPALVPDPEHATDTSHHASDDRRQRLPAALSDVPGSPSRFIPD